MTRGLSEPMVLPHYIGDPLDESKFLLLRSQFTAISRLGEANQSMAEP